MHRGLIALGSNLGDRAEYLERATKGVDGHSEVFVTNVSSWHNTAPIGGPAHQHDYLNGAIRIETTLSPDQLLHHLHRIETKLNRQRGPRWGARTADLDLLLFAKTSISTP